MKTFSLSHFEIAALRFFLECESPATIDELPSSIPPERRGRTLGVLTHFGLIESAGRIPNTKKRSLWRIVWNRRGIVRDCIRRAAERPATHFSDGSGI